MREPRYKFLLLGKQIGIDRFQYVRMKNLQNEHDEKKNKYLVISDFLVFCKIWAEEIIVARRKYQSICYLSLHLVEHSINNRFKYPLVIGQVKSVLRWTF